MNESLPIKQLQLDHLNLDFATKRVLGNLLNVLLDKSILTSDDIEEVVDRVQSRD